DEEVEQSRVVRGLGDLLVGPTGLAELLHLRVGHAIRVSGDGGDELEQEPVWPVEPGSVEVARSASATCPYVSPCNCRNQLCELSQYLHLLSAETYEAIISCSARFSAPSVKWSPEAALIAARKSGRRLIVRRMSGTTPATLRALLAA